MKIVHVSIYPPKGTKHSSKGGVASYTKNLITNIPYTKEDKVFILCDKNDSNREEYVEDGISIIRCFSKNFRYIFQILREIYVIRPQVVHIHQELNLYGGIATAYLLQWLILFTFCKTVVTIHGVVPFSKITKDFVSENNSNAPVLLVKLAFWLIYKPILLWANRVIVHEEYFKNVLVKEYLANPNKVDVVYHGVEDFQVVGKAEACKKLDIDPQKRILLFVGYLTGYKGLDLLIEGFSLYSKIDADAFLLIGAGKHPKLRDDVSYLTEYENTQQKAKNMIENGRYRWVGFVEENEITSYFSAADLSIYPYTISMSSSGPMAMAIGHGKPFFVSNAFRGIFGESIIFERTPQKLCLKIKNFFEKQEYYIEHSLNLKKERLWSVVGDQHIKIYEKSTSIR